MSNSADETGSHDVANTDGVDPTEPKSRDRRRLFAVAVGALAGAIAIGIVVALLLSDDGGNGTRVAGGSRAATTSTSTALPTTTAPATTQPTATTPVAGPGTSSSGGGSGGTTAGGSGTGGVATSTTALTGPVITSYSSSTTTIACPAAGVSTTVAPPSITLLWTTQNTTGVDVSVDGPGVYASYGPSGSTTITVPCDGQTHTYKLTAKGSNGQTATNTISVTTHL